MLLTTNLAGNAGEKLQKRSLCKENHNSNKSHWTNSTRNRTLTQQKTIHSNNNIDLSSTNEREHLFVSRRGYFCFLVWTLQETNYGWV